jgi:hypothetical protein
VAATREPLRVPGHPGAGVRGADLAADDPLRREWDLVVIGPRFAAAWWPGTAATLLRRLVPER